MADMAPPPGGAPAAPDDVPRSIAPNLVIHSVDGPPVHLLLVIEWADTLAFHLAWTWLVDDVRANLRQAYRLEDSTGRSLPVLDSRVMPLAGRMNEVTYFDTTSIGGPQVLSLRLRSQLAAPIALPVGGHTAADRHRSGRFWRMRPR
jgi:hypothetical protein